MTMFRDYSHIIAQGVNEELDDMTPDPSIPFDAEDDDLEGEDDGLDEEDDEDDEIPEDDEDEY